MEATGGVMKLEATLWLESPLSILRQRGTGNQLETLRHVPGRVWRGAVASEIMRERKLTTETAHRDAVFQELFLAGKVQFGDLRPEGGAPWPLSARECARVDKHETRDLLVKAGLGEDLPQECDWEHLGDRRCEGKLKAPEGFYEWDGLGLKKVEAPVRLTGHTAISYYTLRPREGQFFTCEVLDANLRLEGSIGIEEVSAEAAAELRKTRELYLGRGSTRGLGRARLEVAEGRDGDEEIGERLRRLNALFEAKGKVVFTVTLRSPCLVYDEWLCTRSWLTTGDIEEAAGAPEGFLEGYRLEAWYSRMVTISGWNAQAGLPRGDEAAIAAGAAFLFAKIVEASQRDAEIQRLAGWLGQAERGIGERLEEGCGEAVVCDEFHCRRRVR